MARLSKNITTCCMMDTVGQSDLICAVRTVVSLRNVMFGKLRRICYYFLWGAARINSSRHERHRLASQPSLAQHDGFVQSLTKSPLQGNPRFGKPR